MTGGNGLDRGNPRFAIVCTDYLIGKRLSGRLWETYAALAEARIPRTDRTRPISVREIATRLHTDDLRHVWRDLERLRDVGAIAVLERGRGPGCASVYRIVGTAFDPPATVAQSGDGSTPQPRATVAKSGDGTVAKSGDITVANFATGSVGKKGDRVSVSNETAPRDDLSKQMFHHLTSYLTSTGVPDRQARSVIGKWRSDLGGDEHRLIKIATDAQRRGVSEPVGYITKAVNNVVAKQLGGGYRQMASPAGG
jgi:hypothetical protein